MLQPWVMFATGSAVIHSTYTSPVSGSTSIPLGTVLQKGLGFGHAVLRKNVHRGTESLPTIVRGRHVDLAGGKIVVRDVDLIEIRRCLACENGQPWPVVAVGNMGLENEGQLLQG